MRTKVHRKERGGWIAIGTAVIYINDLGVWRETTKSEMEVLDIQSGMTTSNPPIKISIDLPTSRGRQRRGLLCSTLSAGTGWRAVG